MAILLLAFFENALLMIRYERINKNRPIEYGVSFSQIQAERYGSDWKANYIALLDDLDFKKIRVPAYWNRIEPAPGIYDFSETDWMINEASKRNAKIVLLIGQKNIRYPECFYPSWLDLSNASDVSEKAIRMVSEVSSHYKDNPTVESWQLENEFLLKSFGNCPANVLTNSQLSKELKALRSSGNGKKIILSQSDQFGFPFIGPFGDIFGFSMYRWAWDRKIGYFRYPQVGEYFWWKAALINLFYKQDIKVHELQAEAWGPVGNEHLSYDESLKTMNPMQLLRLLELSCAKAITANIVRVIKLITAL